MKKIFRVNRPDGCGKIHVSTYSHESTEEDAKKIANKIEGGFVLKNNKTGLFTVFYPTPTRDVADLK